MLRKMALLALAASTMACNRGPAPPAGAYEVALSGDQTIWTSADIALESTAYDLNSTASVYIDESSSGGDIEEIFYAVGSTPPSSGRLFELRFFTGAFEGETSTTTIAGYFKENQVYASGLAFLASLNVNLVLPGDTETTHCAVYEQYRVVELDGVWDENSWDVDLGASYSEYCANSEGLIIANGFPQTEYQMNGTLLPLYDPFAEVEGLTNDSEVAQ